jgi:hypothetical protein
LIDRSHGRGRGLLNISFFASQSEPAKSSNTFDVNDGDI